MNTLTYEEKVVMEMLIQGSNAAEIISWLELDYREYKKIKLRLLHKLHVKRIIQLLPLAIKLHNTI